jgi:hypothetical protein
MNSTKPWTIVGKKTKEKVNKSSRSHTTPVTEEKKTTPEDIYYSNLSESQEYDHEGLMLNVDKALKNLNHHDLVDALGRLATFALESMTTIVSSAVIDISEIDGDQKQIISINRFLNTGSDTNTTISASLGHYNDSIKEMVSLKAVAQRNMEQFLETKCGVVTIPRLHKNKPVIVKSLDSSINKPSYVSAITSGPNIMTKKMPPVSSMYRKNIDVDTGPVDLSVVGIANGKECTDMGINYLTSCKTFVIKMGSTVFTAGPSNFIDHNSTVRNKYAKRCFNTQPCTYNDCNYYHDPCVTRTDKIEERNFAMGYILQMISSVKNSEDIFEHRYEKDPDFLRDLVQLGGTIIIRAAQIKKLHFPGKKI